MKKNLIILSMALLWYWGCDAPRLNPFDPKADNYITQMVTKVTIHRLYPPNETIPRAKVILENLNFFGWTNEAGYIEWEHQPVDSIVVITQKSGYFTDTTKFATAGLANNFHIYLNAVPEVVASKFYSIHTNPLNLTYIQMEAEITDADGPADIETVYLEVREKAFRDTLIFDNETGNFFTRINIDKLPGLVSPDELPELTFQLVVKNISTDSVVFAPYFIKRVIQEPIVTIAPNMNQTETGPITFQWEKVDLNFNFVYYIVLYSLDGNVRRIGKFGPIPSSETQFTLNDPEVLNNLTDGWYIWILQVEDKIGNIGQSNGLNFQYIR